jgi:pimeloyl-ACP methyl ester carboxylesterase
MRDRQPNVASRTDQKLGLVEEAGFFDGGLFGVSYKPTERTAGAVVICPAILSEYDHTYSIDVSLARALAARGIAVHRFHYRGSGHSDGEPSEMTFETMLQDAQTATARFSAEVGVEEPVLLGVRFGSLVAAALADADAGGGSPLVLWEPALSARTYFREAWRADMMFQINEGAKPATRDAFPALLERDKQVDVLGYPICKALYDSALERTLVGEAGERERRVLILRGGPPGSARVNLDQAVEELRGRGCDVDVEVLDDVLILWFQGPEMRRNARPQVAALIARTVDWVERLAAKEAIA